MSIKDVDADKLIMAAAARMEKMPEFKPPEWASFVKTGVNRERPPAQKNWWWIRSASVLRKLYLNQGLGVNRLRKVYGGRKNRGHKPEHRFPASGAVIRKIVQQLEAAGFLDAKKDEKGKIIKRTISKSGALLLKESALSFSKKERFEIPKKKELQK